MLNGIARSLIIVPDVDSLLVYPSRDGIIFLSFKQRPEGADRNHAP